MLKTTARHVNYWKQRKIDWKQAYFTPEHQHRDYIMAELSKLSFGSLLEVGCGAGANLARVHQHWPGVMLGGLDTNKQAIEAARELNPYVHIWQEGQATDLFFSDKSSDVILTDMCLIYISPIKMKKVLQEFRRVGRKYIVLCEFNSTSFWKRLGMMFWSGYYAYNWKKLLARYDFHDIRIKWIPESPWGEWGYIITARV